MRAAYQRPESALISQTLLILRLHCTIDTLTVERLQIATPTGCIMLKRAKDWDGRPADRVMIVGELGAGKTIVSRQISPYGLEARERLAVVGWRDVHDARVMSQMVCCTRHRSIRGLRPTTKARTSFLVRWEQSFRFVDGTLTAPSSFATGPNY